MQKSKENRLNETRQMLEGYIGKFYSDPQMCVAKAASAFSLSEGYFSQYFKDMTGETFSVYLENRRILQAKELIEAGQLDMEQIASAVGYSSSGTFRRAFKRATGLPPTGWKKR